VPRIKLRGQSKSSKENGRHLKGALVRSAGISAAKGLEMDPDHLNDCRPNSHPVSEGRMNLLVADVSGHGVPAALIASMIKVATQAANGWASDPAQVLDSVGSILNKNVRGQVVSAAYLWIDTAARTATYSAAGHPPLMRWRKSDATFIRIESNGLLFGINAISGYPVCNFPLVTGDRFLLYTDGVTEPENQAGQQFGESRLEQLIRDNQSRRVSEISELLLAEIRKWQPPNVAQQDDITLILVDVLESVKLR
jgi:phosphoserine phosphatase RsbU/P